MAPIRGASPARLEAAPARVDLDLATPLVLIVNEVLSNALKHAFPDGREGTVTIGVQPQEGRVRLTIRDDGIGCPADEPAKAATARPSMGLKLIEMLAQQMAATVDFARDNGTKVTLILPPSAASPR